MLGQTKTYIYNVLARREIHLICEAGSHDFMICTKHNLVLLWELNMTEQIFRTLAYFINISSIQTLGHINLFSPCSFPATFQYLSYILLLQLPQHFLYCPEKHHHNHRDKFIYLLKTVSTHLGDSTLSHKHSYSLKHCFPKSPKHIDTKLASTFQIPLITAM